MRSNPRLYEVVTLREACDWWGRARVNLMMRVYAHERLTRRQVMRKSGGVILLDVIELMACLGKPNRPRPEYDEDESND